MQAPSFSLIQRPCNIRSPKINFLKPARTAGTQSRSTVVIRYNNTVILSDVLHVRPDFLRKLTPSFEQPLIPWGYTILRTRRSTSSIASGVKRQGNGLQPNMFVDKCAGGLISWNECTCPNEKIVVWVIHQEFLPLQNLFTECRHTCSKSALSCRTPSTIFYTNRRSHKLWHPGSTCICAWISNHIISV